MMETEKELIQIAFNDGCIFTLSQEEYHILKKNCQLIRDLEELTTEDDEDSLIIRIPKQHHGFENMLRKLKRKRKRDIKDYEFYIMWEMCIFFQCDRILYETMKEELYDPNILNCLFVVYMCELFGGVPRSVYRKASRLISSYHSGDVRTILIPDAVRISNILKEIYEMHFITSDMQEADFWEDLHIRILTNYPMNILGNIDLNSILEVKITSTDTVKFSYMYNKERYSWKYSCTADISTYTCFSSTNDDNIDGFIIIQKNNTLCKFIFENLRLFYSNRKHKIIYKMNVPKPEIFVWKQKEERVECYDQICRYVDDVVYIIENNAHSYILQIDLKEKLFYEIPFNEFFLVHFNSLNRILKKDWKNILKKSLEPYCEGSIK